MLCASSCLRATVRSKGEGVLMKVHQPLLRGPDGQAVMPCAFTDTS